MPSRPAISNKVGEWHGIEVVAAEELNVLANAEHFRSAADLEHDAGTKAGGVVARVGAKDLNGAGGRRTEAHEKLDCRGFSGAIGTE